MCCSINKNNWCFVTASPLSVPSATLVNILFSRSKFPFCVNLKPVPAGPGGQKAEANKPQTELFVIVAREEKKELQEFCEMKKVMASLTTVGK